MKKFSNKEKIDLIKKAYKKEFTYIELSLLNYEGYSFYICLNYNKKYDSYKLRWFDLEDIIDSNIDKYMSCEYIPNNFIKKIDEHFAKISGSSKYIESINFEQDIVELNAHIKTETTDKINIKFKKYLPKSMGYLLDLFVIIFKNMPRFYENFFFEITAEFTDTTERYEYKKEFDFDLFNSDIDKLFSNQIIERGKKYYEQEKVIFLEKINERYFAIVEGTEKYLVIIKYNEENKKMQVYCSCPCEFYCKHIYSVLLAIKNDQENRFYKIIYKNPNKNLLERIMEFDYLLCLGIVEQNFEVINNYGEIELIPILDKDNQYNWEVLEDSEDEKLTKEVKYFLDNN